MITKQSCWLAAGSAVAILGGVIVAENPIAGMIYGFITFAIGVHVGWSNAEKEIIRIVRR